MALDEFIKQIKSLPNIDDLQGCVVVTDTDGTIRYYTPQFAKLVGAEDSDLTGKNISEVSRMVQYAAQGRLDDLIYQNLQTIPGASKHIIVTKIGRVENPDGVFDYTLIKINPSATYSPLRHPPPTLLDIKRQLDEGLGIYGEIMDFNQFTREPVMLVYRRKPELNGNAAPDQLVGIVTSPFYLRYHSDKTNLRAGLSKITYRSNRRA